MNTFQTQVVTVSSVDWCLRYFKTYYPDDTWEIWVNNLYWGHFHEQLTPPFIIRRLDGEYCLCKDLDTQKILLLHPLEGEFSLLITAFPQYFYNEVIGYHKKPALDLEKPLLGQIIQHFFYFLWQNPKRLFSICTIYFAYELFSLLEPFGLSFLIEHLDFFSKGMDFLVVALFLGLGMGMVWILSYLRQELSLFILGLNAHYFATFVWSRYFSASLIALSKQGVTDVFPRLFSLDQMTYRLLQQFMSFSFDFFYFCINLIILGYINFKLACLDAVGFLILFAISIMLFKRSQQYSRDLIYQQQELQGHSLEMLQHLNQTKLWQKEHLFLGQWKKKNKNYWQAFLLNELQQFKLDWFIDGIKKINYLFIMTFALYLIKQQQLSLGFLIAYLSLKNQVFSRFEGMLRRVNQAPYFKVFLEKLSQLFQKVSPQKITKFKPATSPCYDISMEQVEFRGQRLKNLSFQQGRNYIIDGPSGRGKTSLLKAIMGLDTPLKAKLIYQGKDCQEDDWFALRRDVSIILPEHGLLKGSIMQNISMFSPNPDVSYLKYLCDDLDLDLDLETKLQRTCSFISAGQQQKILLARALYRRPKWLILDEATCHLDEVSEEKILMKILNYPCSLIMVNHRQHVSKLFDQRLVLDELMSF